MNTIREMVGKYYNELVLLFRVCEKCERLYSWQEKNKLRLNIFKYGISNRLTNSSLQE